MVGINFDDWEQRKLGDLGSVAMNKRIFKGETSETGDIPFFKIGTFGGKPDAYITREKFEDYKTRYPYPQVGDILISASGSIGRTIEYKGEEAYYQDSNIVWLNHDESLDNLFLKHFYSIVKWSGIEGTTIKRLYNKNILQTIISIPSIKEQIKIGKFFKQIDDIIALHQDKLENLKQLKKGYIQLMFPQKGGKVPRLRFAQFSQDWKQRKLGELAKVTTGKAFSSEDFSETGRYLVVTNKNIQDKAKGIISTGDMIDIESEFILEKYLLDGKMC